MDYETRQWIITALSVTLAPVLTFFLAMWRIKRLGLNKENMIIVNERAEFRKDQVDRAKAQDEKLQSFELRIEEMRLTNNRLYRRIAHLEASLKANGLAIDGDELGM